MPSAVEPSRPLKKLSLSKTTQQLLQTEYHYTVGGFSPLPAFFVKGQGAHLWDVDGKEFIDFLCMFSAANQGHCHPKITKAVVEQAQTITLVNTGSHSGRWPPFAKMMCTRFGFDKISPMVTGSEAVDTACKIARKWGNQIKGIPLEDCHILGVSGNYHGLTSGVWSLMDPSPERSAYGVENDRMTNVNPKDRRLVRYAHLEDMEQCLAENHTRIAAVIIECIRGQEEDMEDEIRYARGVYDLCKKYNILFIADEIKMGAGKTGKFLSYYHLGDDCKPDITLMGKSIAGGCYPVSYVLGYDETMTLLKPYENASTFAMAPLGIAAAEASLAVIDEENLVERAAEIGRRFEAESRSWKHPLITGITVRGADFGINIDEDHPSGKVTARRICALCIHNGLLVYALEGRVRMSCPLVISDEDVDRALSIIKDALDTVLDYEEIPGSIFEGANHGKTPFSEVNGN